MMLASIAQLYEIYLKYPTVETDTRKLKKDTIYFALRGPQFNGNTFAQQAFELGAAFVVVDELVHVSSAFEHKVIQVEDVLSSLQALAKYHRSQFSIPFIAITGSNGKTTTKELVAAVLSSHFKTYTTVGNLNNHIGVPLTLLSIQADAEMAVIEMGANHQKEIESYCNYTMPTHGLITNCGKAHLEGFGSEAGVRKGKGELFDCLRQNNGTAFVMQDYSYLVDMAKGMKELYYYGTQKGDIVGNAVEQNGFLTVAIQNTEWKETIHTHLVGDYNLPNVLAAVAIGNYFKVPKEKIKIAIEQYTPTNSRSQLLHWNNNEVILDAYNANPSSMQLAVENFAKMKKENKILCLGAMKELGNTSLAEHQALIQRIQQYQWEAVLLVGLEFKACTHPYHYFETVQEAKDWFDKKAYQHKCILIKGSRSIQMEALIAS